MNNITPVTKKAEILKENAEIFAATPTAEVWGRKEQYKLMMKSRK